MSSVFFVRLDNFWFWSDIVRWSTLILRPVFDRFAVRICSLVSTWWLFLLSWKLHHYFWKRYYWLVFFFFLTLDIKFPMESVFRTPAGKSQLWLHIKFTLNLRSKLNIKFIYILYQIIKRYTTGNANSQTITFVLKFTY